MRKAVRVVLFTALLVFVLFVTYAVISWKDTSGEYLSVMKQLKSTPKDTIDVAFVGSSHVYTSVYPAILWKEHGIASFDMSLSEQDKNTSYYCLKQLLKTQKPKVVCVEMYGLMFDGHEKIGDEYRNMMSVPVSADAFRLASETVESDEVEKYITRWPIVHSRYKELDRYDFYNNPLNEFSRGAVMGYGEGAGYIDKNVVKLTESVPLSDDNKRWLDRFIELSQKHGFKLIFFVAPDFESSEEKMISNGAKEYAEALGIEYIDFNCLTKEMGFDPAHDMGDLVHCNADGAYKISSYFGNILTDDYGITSRRGDERYSQWDKDYEYYESVLWKRRLSVAVSNEDFMNILSEGRNVTIILSLDGSFGDLSDYLAVMGIPKEETVNGGKWIYKDHRAEKIMDNNPGESHIIDLNEFDSLKIQCVYPGADAKSNVLFGLDQVNTTENGLNIIVYDDIMKALHTTTSIEQ